MTRTPKVPSDRIQAIYNVIDENISEWHHIASVGQDKGFEIAPTDDQVTMFLHAIGALTDIMRAGMVARMMEAQSAEHQRLLSVGRE